MKFILKINNSEILTENTIIDALSLAFKELGVLHETNKKDFKVLGELQTSRNWNTMEYINTQISANYIKGSNTIEFIALTTVGATNFKRVVFNITYSLYKNCKIELHPILLPEDAIKEPLYNTETESNKVGTNYKPFSDEGFFQQTKLMLMCYTGLAILISPFFVYGYVDYRVKLNLIINNISTSSGYIWEFEDKPNNLYAILAFYPDNTFMTLGSTRVGNTAYINNITILKGNWEITPDMTHIDGVYSEYGVGLTWILLNDTSIMNSKNATFYRHKVDVNKALSEIANSIQLDGIFSGLDGSNNKSTVILYPNGKFLVKTFQGNETGTWSSAGDNQVDLFYPDGSKWETATVTKVGLHIPGCNSFKRESPTY